MTSLAEFLLARIAEDEDLARSVITERDETAGYTVAAHVVARIPEPALTHVLRWGPKNVLVECEAKRQIIESLADEDWFMFTLALPYADHPDYDIAWRP